MNKPQGISIGAIQYWVKKETNYEKGWKSKVADNSTALAMEWCKTGMLMGVGEVDHYDECRAHVKENLGKPKGAVGFVFGWLFFAIISSVISTVVSVVVRWLLRDLESRNAITGRSVKIDQKGIEKDNDVVKRRYAKPQAKKKIVNQRKV